MLSVEFARTRWTRGFRSRNKAAVGEPAAGSFVSIYNIKYVLMSFSSLINYLNIFNKK